MGKSCSEDSARDILRDLEGRIGWGITNCLFSRSDDIISFAVKLFCLYHYLVLRYTVKWPIVTSLDDVAFTPGYNPPTTASWFANDCFPCFVPCPCDGSPYVGHTILWNARMYGMLRASSDDTCLCGSPYRCSIAQLRRTVTGESCGWVRAEFETTCTGSTSS